jgi:putative ABC transport system permease protein
MRAGPLGRAVRGGLARRRVQTLVVAVVLLVSTGAAVLGLALIVDSNAPFDIAFATQRGADVAVAIKPGRATPAQLAATRTVPGVTGAAGPFAQVAASLRVQLADVGPAGMMLPQLTLSGRGSPGGPVDDVALQSGHWATEPGQIVLASNPSGGSLPPGLTPGERVTVTSAPGRPQLTVVGFASSVTDTADGWVTPAEITKLAGPGTQSGEQMLYRFASAGTAADIRADVAAVSRALPPGAIVATQSYLSVRLAETSGIAPIAPFIVAFGIIGLVLAVLIVVNVISGAVVSGYHRIGVLKSIGFTPVQVVVAYMAQALAPAVAGCLAGLVLGNLLAGALLSRAADAYQVGTLGVPPWVNLAVPVAMLIMVGLAALFPASRGGRLSAIQAIAAGRAPRQGGSYTAHRLLGRLWLPRPVTIGLAAPFARPARTAVTLVAVLLGAAAVTFAVGLGTSLSRVVTGLRLSNGEQVQVQVPSGPPGNRVRARAGPPPGTAPSQPQPPSAAEVRHTITTAVTAQPATAHYTAETDQQVSVAGLSQQVALTAYLGNASWLGYDMVSGRWYAAPGEVDVPTYLLTVTGKSVGDTLTFTLGGRLITARIVGEVFDSDNNGLAIITGTRTLAGVDPSLSAPDQYDIGLRAGASVNAYVQALGNALGPGYFVGENGANRGLPVILGLISLLTVLLAGVAGLGVLNTVVLQTREKVHDLGVFKAVGMTPRQTVAMVVGWVAGTGLIAGLLAVPAGVALQHYLVPVMGNAAGTALPATIINAYGGAEIVLLALAGLVIAVAGALAPASWAAAAPTASALRAE